MSSIILLVVVAYVLGAVWVAETTLDCAFPPRRAWALGLTWPLWILPIILLVVIEARPWTD